MSLKTFRHIFRCCPIYTASLSHHLVKAPPGIAPAREEASPVSCRVPPGCRNTRQKSCTVSLRPLLGPAEPPASSEERPVQPLVVVAPCEVQKFGKPTVAAEINVVLSPNFCVSLSCPAPRSGQP
jgi:hypothetical protein